MVFKPEIGSVINYLYLWRNESEKGSYEGIKARPSMIIFIDENDNNELIVYVSPITHTDPKDSVISKEIPFRTKKRLHLDEEKSWVITNEMNSFIWRGPDVMRAPSGELIYGHLPRKFTKATLKQIYDNARDKKLQIINRDNNH
jgi:hypothetical protein